MIEIPILMGGAIVVLLWLAVMIRGSWAAARNYEFLIFFIAMTTVSSWLIVMLPWGTSMMWLIPLGFAALMALGAVTSLIALVRENPLG